MTAPVGFLLAEDAAVKLRFSNIKVTDDRNAQRPVQVFYRYPDNETERNYPFITIENIDISHARQRQHSEARVYTPNPYSASSATAPDALTYWPSTSADLGASAGAGLVAYSGWDFVPVDLLYQVSTFARTALHDRQLTSQMLGSITPFRYGYLHVETDDTIRRFDLLDWVTADLLDPEAGYRKRIFRKVYTIQVSAELPYSQFYQVKRVDQVAGSLTSSVPQTGSISRSPYTITEEF
jgi:hypothetical protein